jgi:ribosomal protein S27AE
MLNGYDHQRQSLFLQRVSVVSIKLESVLTCPRCGYSSLERMPTDQCLIRYKCKRCGFVMTPKEGDCCVFCSYGSVPCPPIQEMRSKETP